MIPEGRERDSGHVVLSHGQMYTLRLGNHCYRRRCDATVFVDGKEVGCFRLSAGQIWTIERPAHDTGRFTFFRSDSAEAATAGVGAVKQEDRGLVHVVFRPELCREEKRSGPLPREIFESHISVDQPQFLMRSCNADAPKNLSSGITGL
ncbi:MAG: hypothetical protein JO110_28465, partial [Acetobacteraceae bacterium]|nr:hypothetical protein [Acetobacteraceae bacterium]